MINFLSTGKLPGFPVTTIAGDQTVLTQQDFDAMLKLVAPETPNLYFVPTIRN